MKGEYLYSILYFTVYINIMKGLICRLKDKLRSRLSPDEIHEICFLTQGRENDGFKAELFELIKDADKRISFNALYVFTKFDLSNNEWLYQKQDELINRVLQEQREGNMRLLLTLLLRQPFDSENLRTDFLDFCLLSITSYTKPTSVRVLCMKLAYEQCKFFPELLEELCCTLNLLEHEPLSSGLATAKKNILKMI